MFLPQKNQTGNKTKQKKKSISSVQKRRGRGEAAELSELFLMQTLVLHCPLSLWAKMTGSWCWGKPKGFILRPSVRKGLWNKFNHSTAFLKVKQRDMICRIWGKPLKTKMRKRKNKPFLRGRFLFVFAAWQGKIWESSGGKGLKERQGTLPPPQWLSTPLLNQAEVFRQGRIIDYKCWNLFQ